MSKLTSNCSFCKKEYVIKPYKLDQNNHFCSRECHYEFMKKRISLPCEACGKTITRKKSMFFKNGNKHNYCNKVCAAQYRSLNPTRIRSNSRSLKYADKIYATVCELCGFDRYIERAHIIPASTGGTIHPANIITLCPNHHSLMDSGRLTTEERDFLDDYIIRAWANPLSLNLEVRYGKT